MMEYTEFEKKALEGLKDCKSEVRHCSENAIRHIEKAWLLKDIDKEMSVFRGITAEEEAASGLLFCLKKYKYNNADKLQFKQHPTKLGLFPFLQNIESLLAKLSSSRVAPFEKYRLALTKVNERIALELIVKLRDYDLDMRPSPPLNFNFTDGDSGEKITFNESFKDLFLI